MRQYTVFLLLAGTLLLIVGCATCVPAPSIAEIGTRAWMEAVERKAVVIDADGHGPDIGSVEWMMAVGLKLGVYDSEAHGPDPGSDEWARAVHFKAFGVRPD